jgi:predicted phosphodiesterase
MGLLLLLARTQALLPCGPVGAAEDTSAVWRFWSPLHSSHFYTTSESEKDGLLANYSHVWVYEEVAFRAFTQQHAPALMPVYRFWSGRLNSHFYTLDETERNKLINDYSQVWTYEGVAFYAYPPGQSPEGTLPVHRYWSGSLGNHFYTPRQTERFTLENAYSSIWQYEGVAWHAYPADSSSEVAIVKGPYLQRVTSDSVVIMWETNVPADSCVGYGAGDPGLDLVFDSGLVTLHKMLLTGLQPDTYYDYQVMSESVLSDPGRFITAPAASRSFRFAVYGDSRSFPSAHAEVTRSIINSDPEIVFHTGDIVGYGRDYQTWGPEFFDPAGTLMMNAPFVPVLGNHEYGGSGPVWFFYFFDRPSNAGWFAMTCGNTRFIGLDSNDAFSPGSLQHDWLLAELTSQEYQDATWHIVIFHHPPFTCTRGHGDDMAVQAYLVPLFEQYGVDIAFQGHSHAYERYLHNGIHYVVTGGGGGPLYALAPDVLPPFRQFGRSVYHHCTVDVDVAAHTLTVQAVDNAGQPFDRIELSKAP